MRRRKGRDTVEPFNAPAATKYPKIRANPDKTEPPNPPQKSSRTAVQPPKPRIASPPEPRAAKKKLKNHQKPGIPGHPSRGRARSPQPADPWRQSRGGKGPADPPSEGVAKSRRYGVQ